MKTNLRYSSSMTEKILEGSLIRKQCTIPVIMVTGAGEVTSVGDILSIVADDYAKKPFQARELVARIEAKLRRIRKSEAGK